MLERSSVDASVPRDVVADLLDDTNGAMAPGSVEDERPMLALYHTLQCNATCDHCIPESGPRQTGAMARHTARHAIEGAKRISDLSLVVFTGGESFLRLPEILELSRYATSLGLKVRIVTNGYWARTPERAARMLERMTREGVDELFISFDEFHLPFVPGERVLNILRGAKQAAAVPYLLYCTVIRPDADSMRPDGSGRGFAWPAGVARILDTYGLPRERCVPQVVAHQRLARLVGREREVFKDSMTRDHALIAWQTLSQAGRASRLMKGQIESRSIDEDRGTPCAVAGRLLTVPTQGHLYPCCSAWTNFGDHSFGAFDSASDFAARSEAMQADTLVRFIHDRGPGELIRALRREGHDLPERYTDICNMCEHLLSRFSLDRLRRETEVLS